MNRERLIKDPTLADLAARMTPRQFAFSIAYLCKGTSIDAYREAYGNGSNDPSRQAYKVRHSPKVLEFIECAYQLMWQTRPEEQ
jgi:hypothetical protein